MKRKQVKEILLQRADQTPLPNLAPEILARAQKNETSEGVSSHRTVKRKRTALRRTLMAVAVAACLALILTPILYAYLSGRSPVDVPDVAPLPVGQAEKVFSDEMIALGSILGYDATDGGYTLSLASYRVDAANGMPFGFFSEKTETDGESSLTQEERVKIAEAVHRYFLVSNDLLTQDTRTIDYAENTGDTYPNYRYRMTVRSPDGTSFTAYFNRAERENGEIILEGVFLTESGTYPLRGKQKTKESEVEMSLTLTLPDNSSIHITNERETDEGEYEYEYKYAYYRGDLCYRAVSLSLEEEENEREVSIKITEDGETASYQFTWEEGEIECKYRVGEVNVNIRIVSLDGQWRYRFEDGTHWDAPLTAAPASLSNLG